MAESINDKYFLKYEQLLKPETDLLKEIPILLEKQDYLSKTFCKYLSSRFPRQYYRYYECLVIKHSLEDLTDYSQMDKKEFIKTKCGYDEIKMYEQIYELKYLNEKQKEILIKIKNDELFDEEIDYSLLISDLDYVYKLIESFRSFKLFKQMIERKPELISMIRFSSFTKEEFLQFCPNQKPSKGNLPWVYELNPDFEDKIEILLHSSFASQLESKYFPSFIFPFLRKELFPFPEKTNYEEITNSLDKICPRK